MISKKNPRFLIVSNSENKFQAGVHNGFFFGVVINSETLTLSSGKFHFDCNENFVHFYT